MLSPASAGDSRKTAGVQRQAPMGIRPPPPIRHFPPHSQIPSGHPPKGPPDASNRAAGAHQGTQPLGRQTLRRRQTRRRGGDAPGAVRPRGLGQPGGHSEGPNTRSHPELGRENPQRRWYCRSSGGRAGRRQARQTPYPNPGRATPPTRPDTPPNTPPPRGGAAR
jgi:hypothetical protein